MAVEAHIKWTDELQFIGRSGNGPAVIMDSTDGASGATPMQMLLFGIAGCTGIDVVLILQKKRLNLTGFEVFVKGEQAENPPQRYTEIEIEYRIYGTDIKPKAAEQAISLSEEKYCSAMASVNAEFKSSYQILAPEEQTKK